MAERPGWWPEEPDADGDRDATDRPADAREREAEEAEVRPPRGLASPGAPRPRSRYTLFVGLAFIVLVGVAILNAIQTEEGGIAGPSDAGRALPGFAVPDARTGPEEADANIAQDDCEADRNPCPDGQVRTPACEIEAPGAIRVCDLFDRPLVLSFWFTQGGDCLPTQDAFDRVAGRFEDSVNFLSVNVLDDRQTIREIIEGRGWSVPVGHDADGAVSNIYRIGVCPTLIYAYPGGVVHDTVLGSQAIEELEASVNGLLRATRERGSAE